MKTAQGAVRGEGGGDTARPCCPMQVPAPERCQQARREGDEDCRLANAVSPT
jgi:hypothetical protein